jgi:hypothetical protein
MTMGGGGADQTDPRSDGGGRPPVRELPFGADCYAVNLQVRPPAGTRADLVRLRDALAESTGLAMQHAPAETLHLTAFSIVYVRAVYPTPPESVWAMLERPVTEALHRVAGRTAPFTLAFDRAGLRGDAVIIEAEPNPHLETIRDAVEAAITGLAPVFRTATTHATVARLDQPVASAWSQPLGTWPERPVVEWSVEAMRLVLERRYPALDETPLKRFPLTGK